MDWDALAKGMPVSFGKQIVKKVSKTAEQIESTKRQQQINLTEEGPIIDTRIASTSTLPLDSTTTLDRNNTIAEEEDDDDDEEDDRDWVETREGFDLPVSHEVVMKDHSKTVSALSIDPSGTRFVSGSYDYDAKLWDFGGMTSAFKPFRSWEIKENHQIHDLQFSIQGDSFLAATGSNTAKLYDRNGIETLEFNKGDMYIRDLRHTDGHIAALSSVAWHPKQASLFLSASADSTIRLWDVSNKRKSKSVIVVKSKERGGRTKVSACAWSGDARTIGAACEDGAIHLWSASSNFARPNSSVEGAHEKGTVTSSIVFTSDGQKVATRGGDGTVKLWDTRSFKKPLYVSSIPLPSLNPETNLIFSPDEKYLLTGTAGSQAGVLVGSAEEERAKEAIMEGAAGGGKVVVLKTEGLDLVRSLTISPYSVVRVLWHPKINQILTGSADGSIHALYSPLTSLKGITLAVTRAPRRRAIDDNASFTSSVEQQIIAPHSLPMYKEDHGENGMLAGRGGKRKRERERHDPVKTMKPMPPMVGAGRGGRVGTSATSHLVKTMVRDNTLEQDPREALLKYAVAVEDNEWTSAWTENQPKPVFDMRPDPAEEENDKKR